MNPFLYDTVAQPLPTSPLGAEGLPFTNQHAAVQAPLKRRGSYGARHPRAGMMALVTVAGMGSFSAMALDVNRASQAELQAIKGVGPRTAQIIVQERARAGHFESMQDLSERVRGIGVKKLQTMQQAGLAVGLTADANGDFSGGSASAARAASEGRVTSPGSRSQDSRRSHPAGRISPIVADVIATQALSTHLAEPTQSVSSLPVPMAQTDASANITIR